MSDNASGNDSTRKRRRRRRRRRGPRGSGDDNGAAVPESFDDVLVAEPSAPVATRRKGRRQAIDITGPTISVPSSGRNPQRKRNSRPKRNKPTSAQTRKRHLSKSEMGGLQDWLGRMPEQLLANLYRGLGGQPGRVGDHDRMLQLTARALTQGSRLGGVLKQLQERDRRALVVMLQCGGIAHNGELMRELMLSFGGHEREWQRTMTMLANRGLIMAHGDTNHEFFYVLPPPLTEPLLHALEEEMALPTFEHEDMRVLDEKPFCPPLDFSVTTLATYIDQHAPRFTQRQEIYRHDQDSMDQFFSQIWGPDSELFAFHLDFLMMHGMVGLRGEFLSLNKDVMEEWLNLEPEDQRDLLFRALDKRFPMGEWILWAIHGAGQGWIPERPLAAMYRRWKKGEDWRARYKRGEPAATRTGARESYSFSPMVLVGLLEMGQWGQEKFYRLAPRGKHLLEPTENDGFAQFYLTPSFEIMAPAGLAPVLLFRIGELADLVGCDRANTYRITDTSIERALERGWRRDDALQFLRDNSQIGLPDNVEDTLKGWIGHRGDVEFHDLCILTVHPTQIRRIEGNKRIKPYLLHRFAPGMYAIDRHRRDEVASVLRDGGLDPSKDVRGYPGDPEQVEARKALRTAVAEAREAAVQPSRRSDELTKPETLTAVPGTKLAGLPGAEPEQPPEVTVAEVRPLIDKAMATRSDIEMVYRTRQGTATTCIVQPQRIAIKADSQVLVGLDRDEDERRTFIFDRIERLRIVEEE